MKLIDAPIGLFEFDGTLVLKTEYSVTGHDGVVTPECYIVESGELFWGGVSSFKERNNLDVTPVEYRRHTCPHRKHEWLEDCDASDYPNYCPDCGKPLRDEESQDPPAQEIFRRFVLIGPEDDWCKVRSLMREKGLSHEDVMLILETVKLNPNLGNPVRYRISRKED